MKSANLQIIDTMLFPERLPPAKKAKGDMLPFGQIGIGCLYSKGGASRRRSEAALPPPSRAKIMT